VLVADNATIHLTAAVAEILENNNLNMTTIAPYSPYLNPAEKYINSIKESIKAVEK
jgi:transposase